MVECAYPVIKGPGNECCPRKVRIASADSLEIIDHINFRLKEGNRSESNGIGGIATKLRRNESLHTSFCCCINDTFFLGKTN